MLVFGYLWWFWAGWEKRNGVGDAFGFGLDDVDCVASVVLEGGSNVPSLCSMGIPRGAVGGEIVDEDFGAWGC